MTNDMISRGLVLPDRTTTSLIVAERFGKRHDDVLKRIRNLECSPKFSARNFAEADYFDEQGKPRPMYRLTRDGFTMLAMGFTGEAAMAWKERFIDAFNEMERTLLSPIPGTAMLEQVGKLLMAEREERLAKAKDVDRQLFTLDDRVTRLEKRKRANISREIRRIHLRCLRWLSWRCPLTGEPIPHTEDGEPLLGAVEYDHFFSNQLPDLKHTWPLSKNGHAVLTRGKMTRDEAHTAFMSYQWSLKKMVENEPQQLDIFRANANAHA